MSTSFSLIKPGIILKKRYRVIRELGEGGFSKTFEVDDKGVPKVLKVLSNNSPKAIELFQREAEVLKALNHSGIPKVESDGYFTVKFENAWFPCHCLVMEKIEGETLEQWLKKQDKKLLSEKEAIAWLKQLVNILSVLHSKDYLHRDIKPDNIMLKPNGQLVLIDFGAVRELTQTYLYKLWGTKEATKIGTPGFISIEQSQGKAFPQSDFFSLGYTFISLLTGKHPLDFNKYPEKGKLIWRHAAPQISKPFADIIDWLSEPFLINRPQTTDLILQKLEASYHKLDFNKWLIFYWNLVQKQDSAKVKFKGLAIKLGLTALLIGISIPILDGVRKQQAIALNDKGVMLYSESPNEALNYIKLSLLLFPSNSPVSYNLGMFCEKLEDWDCAYKGYQKAAFQKIAAAYGNLGRLFIFDENYSEAIAYLNQGLEIATQDYEKYALIKNLGWARLKLGDYIEAEKQLKSAIELNGDRAAAYCLLAQVKEAQGNIKEATPFWENCYIYTDSNNVDEREWLKQASVKKDI